MKVFGPSFKPLHATGMGTSSGMSEGLGSDWSQEKYERSSERTLNLGAVSTMLRTPGDHSLIFMQLGLVQRLHRKDSHTKVFQDAV
jgi:hypothetical protein